MTKELKNELALVMTPARAAVLADYRSTVDVLVRVQAPLA